MELRQRREAAKREVVVLETANEDAPLPEADAIVHTRRALVEGSLLMGLYADIG